MADLSAIPTEELMRMRGAPAGGADLSKISTEDLMKMRSAPDPERKSLIRRSLEITTAPLEAGLSLGTGVIGSLIGGAAGIVRGVTGGNYGTPEGGREASARAAQVASDLTYRPRGEVAQEGLRTIGELLDKSKLAGLGPNEAMAMAARPAAAVAPAVRRPVAAVQDTVGGMLRGAEPQMAGVGAAETGGEAMRRARAEALPVPVKLSKGEASRDFKQQRFERETAKEGSEAGELLRKHGAEQNVNLTKNLEWFLDESGAAAPTARATGSTVDNALRSRSEFLKGKYRDAYQRAEAAGETAQLVDTTPLLKFINENAASKGTASIIKVAEDEAVRLGGATRTKDGILFPEKMSINDIEQMRKRIVRDGQGDATNAHYASKMNEVIDAMTEGKGGALYKEARTLFKDHAAEFKNQGAIKKLLATKPGTTDRSVAYEDVFKHSVLGGSMDDTAAILRSLDQAGPKGAQAKAELKGATIKYLQDQASKNTVRDVNGNPILSHAKLNAVVKELEIDGKLELLFGKKGAQTIRDITDTIGDLNVAPAGVVNTSTTAAVLKEALGAALTGRLPTATVKTVQAIKGAVGEYRNLRLAREAIAPADGPLVVRPTVH